VISKEPVGNDFSYFGQASRRLTFRAWLLVFLMLAFGCGMFWSVSRDPFTRVEISLCPSTAKELEAMAVLPKPVGCRPVVYFFYGSNGSLLRSGNELRRLAELGFAAVGMEYDQASQTNFNEQFRLLDDFVRKQPWADTNAMAWVGFSLGAQRSLTYLLQHPERQPQLLVRVAGGWVGELDGEPVAQGSAGVSPASGGGSRGTPTPSRGGRTAPLFCPVLIVHGERDRTFPLERNERLAALLTSNGVPVQSIILPGQGHAFAEDRPVVMRGVAEYLAQYFGSPPRALTNVPPWNLHYWIPAAVWLGFGVIVAFVRLHRWSREAGKPSRILQVATLILGVCAVWLTAVNLVTPRCPVSDTTLKLARSWIIRSELREWFDYLASKPPSVWQGGKLNALLTHLDLSDLQRTHFLKPEDETLFRDYVLSPEIDAESLLETNWRREMWENFYPRIRKTKDPTTAAEIIIRFLRDRVTITDRADAPEGLVSIWVKQTANLRGFHRIYVAALRSVGIPARLNGQHRAEFWTGAAWATAPPPLVERWEVESGMKTRR
jgi:pimeloyl-ACP methyl ester carboxylesterase